MSAAMVLNNMLNRRTGPLSWERVRAKPRQPTPTAVLGFMAIGPRRTDTPRPQPTVNTIAARKNTSPPVKRATARNPCRGRDISLFTESQPHGQPLTKVREKITGGRHSKEYGLCVCAGVSPQGNQLVDQMREPNSRRCVGACGKYVSPAPQRQSRIRVDTHSSGARIMPGHYHAVVWIDHHQAKIFHIDASGSDLERVRSWLLYPSP